MNIIKILSIVNFFLFLSLNLKKSFKDTSNYFSSVNNAVKIRFLSTIKGANGTGNAQNVKVQCAGKAAGTTAPATPADTTGAAGNADATGNADAAGTGGTTAPATPATPATSTGDNQTGSEGNTKAPCTKKDNVEADLDLELEEPEEPLDNEEKQKMSCQKDGKDAEKENFSINKIFSIFIATSLVASVLLI